MSHVVISALPGRRFTVDYLSGEPRKVLERWRRDDDRRLPVAAFAASIDAYSTVCFELYGFDVFADVIAAVTRCPLEEPWRSPVQRYAAAYEGAAAVLAQLLHE